MNGIKVNFAYVFSFIVLFVFSYITFLGLDYWKGGKFLLPTFLTLGFIVLTVLCTIFLCKSKADINRWKKTRYVLVFFSLITLIIFILASVPFTNFLRVVDDKEDLYGKIQKTCEAATGMNAAYSSYVDGRVSNYQNELCKIAEQKILNIQDYDRFLGGAFGISDHDKILSLANSLRKQLLPQAAEQVEKRRNDWLSSASTTKVWNLLTPSNVNQVEENVKIWKQNFIDLSSTVYQGEKDVSPFTYSAFDTQLEDLTSTYEQFQKPKVWVVFVSIICFGIMLLPFWLTEEAIAGVESKEEELLFVKYR